MFVGLRRSTTDRRQCRTRRRQWRDNGGRRRRIIDSRGKTMAEFCGFILKEEEEEEDLKAIEQYVK